MDLNKIERDVRERFADAGLSPFFVEGSSELFDLNGQLHAEVFCPILQGWIKRNA